MTFLNEILKWTESLPGWQRDACRRLFVNESGLEANDYSELYALLKKENGIQIPVAVSPIPLSSDHLPVESSIGDTVTLAALRNLENVNQIPSEHVLTFSENGMTVIYGGNGSGKSGYARVIKRACRARDQSERVHPNANDPNAASRVPSATFDVKVAGASAEILWSRDAPPPDRLSTISVFDARCARSYITAEQDVAYLPYGLDIVENLANVVLPKLSEMLEAEIEGIDTDTLPFEHLLGETEVGKAIEGLSGKTEVGEIAALGTLTEGETKRVVELKTALSEADPLSRSKELRLSAKRLKTYAERLEKPLGLVSTEAVEKLKVLASEKETAEAAEAKAADALRAGEVLLQGTGEQVWKRLFEAARRYSTEVAYPDDEFPFRTEDKSCPLCQQALGQAGTQRLKRFDEYIKNDVAKTADVARDKVNIARDLLEAAELVASAEEALSDELNALDASLLHVINEYHASIESRRKSILECLKTFRWAEVSALVESPRARVRQLAARQLVAFRTLVRAADKENKKKLEKELSELSARQSLSASLKGVLELLERMKRRASLEKCRSSLKTRQISDKSKEFATVAVTNELKKALDREFNALGIGHIRTRLKERSVRGKMFHQLLLDVPTTSKIDEILSEGEQRAIALGSFFAELALANHSCGIVFDDPVSSLDHWRRRDVARRLVEEARKRQVIVFTHDTSFLGQLQDEIDAADVPNAMSYLEWRAGLPGSVNNGLPWDHQGYKARIDALEQAQSKLAKTWPTYPSENEKGEMRHQYDRLRATLERVIQDVVFNGVVKRYRDWIKVNELQGVVGFSRAECEDIERLHKRCSDVVTAHDTPSEKTATVPTAREFESDISALKAIVEKSKSRKGPASVA